MDEVLVVGAGPVGLTVGIELLQRGVPCRVVEAPQYAKAMSIQPRTLEVWDNLGVLHDALDAAIPIHGQLVHIQLGAISNAGLSWSGSSRIPTGSTPACGQQTASRRYGSGT